jgi:hypothetical protein
MNQATITRLDQIMNRENARVNAAAARYREFVRRAMPTEDASAGVWQAFLAADRIEYEQAATVYRAVDEARMWRKIEGNP